MSGPKQSKTAKRAPDVFVAAPQDAGHVKAAFDADDANPEARETVSPEELRRWAETGECPESSD